MHSCIYSGWVRHRRYEPASHQFRYQLFMMYLDLVELPQLFDPYWGWSARRRALAQFRRSDYHHTFNDGDDEPYTGPLGLDEAVRRTVTSCIGRRPTGPIRMLTHLRYFGYIFNPVTVYFCFDSSDTKVQTLLVEITNTPWRERHSYVLPLAAATRVDRLLRFEFGKEFHVSPFWPMDMRYDWRLTTPGDDLRIHMVNLYQRDGHARRVFDATLSLQREEISRASLSRTLLRFPLMTAQVSGALYWQGLRRWLRRTPLFTQPKLASEARSQIARDILR